MIFHFVTNKAAEAFVSRNRDSDILFALCGTSVDTLEMHGWTLSPTVFLESERPRCPHCAEHPDLALHILGSV